LGNPSVLDPRDARKALADNVGRFVNAVTPFFGSKSCTVPKTPVVVGLPRE
jgi:hypothetical protein